MVRLEKVNIEISNEEIAEREQPCFKLKHDWISSYTALVTSAHTGGIMRVPKD